MEGGGWGGEDGLDSNSSQVSNYHDGSGLPLRVLCLTCTTDIFTGKYDIRGLIRWKTMGHKSANDKITRQSGLLLSV